MAFLLSTKSLKMVFLHLSHGARARIVFGKQFVAWLANELSETNVETWLETQVIDVDKATKTLTVVSPRGKDGRPCRCDSVCVRGARKTRSERGWIVGDRPARQFFTMQLLQLLDGCHTRPMERPAIIGSDLIAYSAAAKLRSRITAKQFCAIGRATRQHDSGNACISVSGVEPIGDRRSATLPSRMRGA